MLHFSTALVVLLCTSGVLGQDEFSFTLTLSETNETNITTPTQTQTIIVPEPPVGCLCDPVLETSVPQVEANSSDLNQSLSELAALLEGITGGEDGNGDVSELFTFSLNETFANATNETDAPDTASPPVPIYRILCCPPADDDDDDKWAGVPAWGWLLIGLASMCCLCLSLLIVITIVMRPSGGGGGGDDSDDDDSPTPQKSRETAFGDAAIPSSYKRGDRVEVQHDGTPNWVVGTVVDVVSGAPMVQPDGASESQRFASVRHIEQQMAQVAVPDNSAIRIPKQLPPADPKDDETAFENDYLIAANKEVYVGKTNKMPVTSLHIPQTTKVNGGSAGAPSLSSPAMFSPANVPMSPLSTLSIGQINPSSGQGPLKATEGIPLSYSEHRSQPQQDTSAFSKEVASMV